MKKGSAIGLVLVTSAIFLFTACTKGPNTINSQPAPKVLNLTDGKSLSQCGYRIEIPDQEIGGKPLISICSVLTDENYLEPPLPSGFTVISINFSYINGADIMEYMYLKAFAKQEILKNNEIEIMGKKESLSALEPHIIFSDQSIVVYDLIRLVQENSLKDRIQREIANVNHSIEISLNDKIGNDPVPAREPLVLEDYLYMLDVAKYFDENIDKLIKPIEAY